MSKNDVALLNGLPPLGAVSGLSSFAQQNRLFSIKLACPLLE
jgi:hypothetical protein